MDMEKINAARERITKESLEIGGALANFIEEHLTNLCKSEAVADKLLAEGKTLGICLTKIEGEARKVKTGNVACLSESEVAEIVDKYYDLDAPKGPVKSESIDILDLI